MGTTLVCTVNIVCSVLSTDNIHTISSEYIIIVIDCVLVTVEL